LVRRRFSTIEYDIKRYEQSPVERMTSQEERLTNVLARCLLECKKTKRWLELSQSVYFGSFRLMLFCFGNSEVTVSNWHSSNASWVAVIHYGGGVNDSKLSYRGFTNRGECQL